jgi:hypothetical protein
MGWKNSNLQTEMTRLLRRAGVSGWPRLFHSMRASRQTELQREFPLHVVCSWLGNSPRIAKQSYLLVTDEGFSRTLGGKKAKRAAYRPPVLFFHQRGQTSDPLRLGLAPCSIGGHPQCTQPENRHRGWLGDCARGKFSAERRHGPRVNYEDKISRRSGESFSG